MAQQPAGMLNTFGAVVTCGMFCNSEAFELVMACATNNTALDRSTICQDAVNSWIASILSDVQPILSSSGYIAFVSAEAMINGAIPVRIPFASTDNPGLGAAGAVPTNACGLGVIYEDPADALPGARIRIAKSFFSGIPAANVVQNTIDTALAGHIFDMMSDLQSGWPSVDDSSTNWYRVLNVPKPRTAGQPIVRTLVPEARNAIYTQKRRLVPRP